VFWDRHKDDFAAGQIAQSLNFVSFVEHDGGPSSGWWDDSFAFGIAPDSGLRFISARVTNRVGIGCWVVARRTMTDKERKAARKATQKQYCDSDKGKAASRKSSKRYASSDKGKSVSKRYAQSPEGKLANKRYAQSPEGKAAKKRSREKQKLKR